MGALRILEIEIENFKTFRHECIPFLPGFTAISGPNGSGKSNILDALLFALGLSSNRTMRAEKGTDLINNASSHREARVSVRLGVDNDDSLLRPEGPVAQKSSALPIPQIEISRRIKESQVPGGATVASSTYYLNGRVASLTEVHDILALHHITPSGYNVVMQGDVTSIIRMTGTERRRIIDEVAGVADFDARIEQAHKELQTVSEQEERTGLLLVELSRRLEALHLERDRALAYLAVERELEGLAAAGRLAACWELAESVRGLEQVMIASGTRRSGLETLTVDAQAALKQARACEDALTERLRADGGAAFDEVEVRVRQTWEDVGRTRLEAAAALTKAEDFEEAAQRAAQEATTTRADLRALETKLEAISGAILNHTGNASQLEAARLPLQNLIDGLISEKDEVQARSRELRARSDGLHHRLNELQTAEIKVQAVRSAVEERLDQRRKDREAQHAQFRRLQAEAERLDEVAIKAWQAIENARSDEYGSRENTTSLDAKLAQVEASAREARQALAVAEQQLHAQESSLGGAIDAVMQAGILGVVGTILELGESEPEFSRALQEAAGPRLRHIVVQDDVVASKVSKFLHSRQAGRVTCLPLNRLQPPRRLQPIRLPGCLGYALTKVKFDPKYEAVFFHAFGDTLVFENFEAARPYIGQYRMVTLEGDVIDKGGAMTVGRVRGEPVQFLANLKAAFEAAKNTFQATTHRVASHQQALESMKQAAASAESRRREAESFAHTQDLAKQGAIHAAREAEVRMAELDTALALDQQESERLGLAVDRAIDDRIPVEEEFNFIEFELSDLQESLGDGRLVDVQNRAQQLGWEAQDQLNLARGLQLDCDHLNGTRLEWIAREQAATEQETGMREQALSARNDAARLTADQVAFEARLTHLEAERLAAKMGLEKLAADREVAREDRHRKEGELNVRKLDLERFDLGMRQTAEKLDERVRQLRDVENALWEDGISLPEERPPMTPAAIDAARIEASARLAQLGKVNHLAVEQYDCEVERATSLRIKARDLQVERTAIAERIEQIGVQKNAVFLAALAQINGYFGEIFNDLAGGSARLSLEDPQDPFAGGLILHAQPPGSRVYRLEAMSGGERSLTALAFLFAIQRTQPAPFYALDEVDHALDGVNDERLARTIDRQAAHAQMIVISHRKPMISHSHQAIGVHSRPDGSTRVTGIRWGRQRRLLSEVDSVEMGRAVGL